MQSQLEGKSVKPVDKRLKCWAGINSTNKLLEWSRAQSFAIRSTAFSVKSQVSRHINLFGCFRTWGFSQPLAYTLHVIVREVATFQKGCWLNPNSAKPPTNLKVSCLPGDQSGCMFGGWGSASGSASKQNIHGGRSGGEANMLKFRICWMEAVLYFVAGIPVW